MIKVSTVLVFSGNLRSSSVICNVPVRILLSLKQKRLIASSATISSSAVEPSVCALDPAISILERKRAEKSASFFNLFRDYGFEDSQIQKFSENTALGRRSVRNLKPKLDCLVENGFTGELLHKLIVPNPYILLASLDARIKPQLQLLKKYIGSDENVVKLINRNRRFFSVDLELYLVPNIEFLINEGVPIDRVSKLLLAQPKVFLQSLDKVVYAVKTVKEFGIALDEDRFISCFRAVYRYSDSNLEKKLEVFKSFGWSDEQVPNIFMRAPTCLSLSPEIVRSKIGFYLNTIELKPETVIRHPDLLIRSVDMIRARYEVLKILKSKELIKGARITSIAKCSEDRFLNAYVIKHEESVPGLLDLYYGISRGNKKG